ncbi:PAS domain-containing protein [bacterium]|nr:PAS domain-containing protein [candidate division CSSED10-310 bacterium]
MTLFVGAMIGITTICGFWLHSEEQLRDQQTRQDVNFQKSRSTRDLVFVLEEQMRIAGIVGHSLSLRRYIIEFNQMIMRDSAGHRDDFLIREAEKWRTTANGSGDPDEIWDSLEAEYLRSILTASHDVMDRIFVTDALGFIRIATHPPDRIHVFDEDWWQRALILEPGQVYQYTSDVKQPHENYLHFSLPLYNDEGIDAVGVVHLRIDLSDLFDEVLGESKYGDPHVIFVTDQNLMYPSLSIRHPFSIGEIINTSRMAPDLYTDKRDQYYLGTDSLAGRIRQTIPDISWSIISYRPRTSILSISHPVFRKAFALWLIGLMLMLLICHEVTGWITQPIQSIIRTIRTLADGTTSVRVPENGHGEIADLSKAVNQLAETIEESATVAAKMLRETNASLTAFEDFTQEAALEHDRRLISDALLRLAVRKLNADAGVLFIHNPDYKAPMILRYNIGQEQLDRFTSMEVHGSKAKQVFFAWDHPNHQTIWDEGYQVMLAAPIRTRHSKFGTIYLLFYQAIDSDLVKDRTIELMALQGAVYMSRSALFHQLNRQASFTEGILSGIPWFICTLDSGMQITWHNHRIEDLPHGIRGELVGSRCCTVFRERSSICPDCPARLTLSDGNPHEITQRWPGPSGEIRWIRVNSFPSMDETGQMKSVILFIRDITSETHAQSEIRQYARAIDSIGEAVLFTDMDHRIMYANRAFFRIFNYQDQDVKGLSVDLLFPADTREILDDITATTRRDLIWTREIELATYGDDRVTCSLIVSLVREDSGLPVGLVYTCIDITKRVNRERKMIRNYRELEILHATGKLLSQNADVREILHSVLEQITDFSGSQSGALLLYAIDKPEDSGSDEIRFTPARTGLYVERQLPGYFYRFIEEVQQGRESAFITRVNASEDPVVLNRIQSAGSMEEKLFKRMGFQSAVFIPIRTRGRLMGFLCMFSNHSFHFSRDSMDVFRSISSQIGVSLYGKYLQTHIVNRARHMVTSEMAARIGGDVKQVLQMLEITRYMIESGVTQKAWDPVEQGWIAMSRHIWQLYHVTLNILSYSIEDERLYFPESLNGIVRRCIHQMEMQAFAQRIDIRLIAPDEDSEIYVNKPAFHRALTNLLILAVESTWHTEHPGIRITVHDAMGAGEHYAVDIVCSGARNSILEINLNTYRAGGSIATLPVLLSGAIKSIEMHGGSVFIARPDDSDESTVRIMMPRFPATS